MPIDVSGSIFRDLQAAEQKARALEHGKDFLSAAKQWRLCHHLMTQYAKQPGVGDMVQRMRLERAEQYLTQAGQADVRAQQGGSSVSEVPEANDYRSTIESLITQVDVTWADIGGLEQTKEGIQANYALGLVRPPDGVKIRANRNMLLFGPPGTGKTMLAAAMSKELDATFFNVRIPDLMSQYFGESSKLLSALYTVAADYAPSVIFLDEIDALSRQRGGGQESGAERRLLNTFLGELDGLRSKGQGGPVILTIGATNIPWELDSAILSRFSGGLVYVPLPDEQARSMIFNLYIDQRGHVLQFSADKLIARSQGYAGREIEQIVNLAVTRMLRRANPDLLQHAADGQEALRKYHLKTEPLSQEDFEVGFSQVRPGASPDQIAAYEQWRQRQ